MLRRVYGLRQLHSIPAYSASVLRTVRRTFYERKENRFCAACRTARKKQAQRHWCRVNGMSRK